MKKRLLFILILGLAASLLAGCAQTSGTGSITVTDTIGNEVVLEKTPEKIIAMVPSDVEIIYALGAQDKIIAVGEYANFPEDVQNKAAVGSGMNTNIEEIIDLEPDLVIMGQMAQLEEQMDQLKQAGIAVVISNSQTIEDTYAAIAVIGQVTGKSSEAETIIKDMKAGFEAIQDKAQDKEAPKAYIEVSPLQFGLWTCGTGTFIQELLDIVGIENVFADVEGWAQISEEQVLDKNPDIILTTVGISYGIERPVEDILEREDWTNIKAVSDSRVFMVDSDKTARPGPRLLEAAQDLYALVYGE